MYRAFRGKRYNDRAIGKLPAFRCIRRFLLIPHGFPPEVIDAFCKATGRGVLGNYPASGTAIIDELGVEHIQTGKLIVYTSADSVFQIAAHEEIVPPQELWHICQQARDLLQGEHGVGRVIARPFIGKPGRLCARVTAVIFRLRHLRILFWT